MGRHMYLEIISKVDGTIVFRVRNTHRGYGLTDAGNSFTASNGWQIKSVDVPELRSLSHILFVQGRSTCCDNATLAAGATVFRMIEEAVNEYNVEFGLKPILVV